MTELARFMLLATATLHYQKSDQFHAMGWFALAYEHRVLELEATTGYVMSFSTISTT